MTVQQFEKTLERMVELAASYFDFAGWNDDRFPNEEGLPDPSFLRNPEGTFKIAGTLCSPLVVLFGLTPWVTDGDTVNFPDDWTISNECRWVRSYRWRRFEGNRWSIGYSEELPEISVSSWHAKWYWGQIGALLMCSDVLNKLIKSHRAPVPRGWQVSSQHNPAGAITFPEEGKWCSADRYSDADADARKILKWVKESLPIIPLTETTDTRSPESPQFSSLWNDVMFGDTNGRRDTVFMENVLSNYGVSRFWLPGFLDAEETPEMWHWMDRIYEEHSLPNRFKLSVKLYGTYMCKGVTEEAVLNLKRVCANCDMWHICDMCRVWNKRGWVRRVEVRVTPF